MSGGRPGPVEGLIVAGGQGIRGLRGGNAVGRRASPAIRGRGHPGPGLEQLDHRFRCGDALEHGQAVIAGWNENPFGPVNSFDECPLLLQNLFFRVREGATPLYFNAVFIAHASDGDFPTIVKHGFLAVPDGRIPFTGGPTGNLGVQAQVSQGLGGGLGAEPPAQQGFAVIRLQSIDFRGAFDAIPNGQDHANQQAFLDRDGLGRCRQLGIPQRLGGGGGNGPAVPADDIGMIDIPVFSFTDGVEDTPMNIPALGIHAVTQIEQEKHLALGAVLFGDKPPADRTRWASRLDEGRDVRPLQIGNGLRDRQFNVARLSVIFFVNDLIARFLDAQGVQRLQPCIVSIVLFRNLDGFHQPMFKLLEHGILQGGLEREQSVEKLRDGRNFGFD